MRHLGREVKDDVAPPDQPTHLLLVADVGNVGFELARDLADVRRVAAVPLDHRVADGDAGSVADEADREARTDETEAARDEDVFPGEGRHFAGSR